MNLQNHFGLLFVLLSCVWSHTNAQLRIIGGHNINIEDSAHSVAIFVNNNIYNCVGSIVNFKSVLTAAHCVKEKNMQNLVVLAGVTSTEAINTGIGQQRFVEDIHIDPNYNPQTKFMDIAIVKVDIPFEPNLAVKIIPLCDVPLKPGSWMQISGWGSLHINSETSSHLLKTKFVKIADTQKCRNAYANIATPPQYYAETIMYAGRSGKDMSSGDSGAAGVENERLCAVATAACSNPNFPVLYTNVSNPKVREFIKRWM